MAQEQDRVPLRDGAERRVRLAAVGQRFFVSGIANRYDARFPSELEGVMDRELFEQAMQRINATVADYWPCGLVFWGGLLACPFTLGLSLLVPRMCVKNSEDFARLEIRRMNARAAFQECGVTFALRRGCCTSWVEVAY